MLFRQWLRRPFSQTNKSRAQKRRARLELECLEDRTVPSISLSTSSWTPIGPAPILGYPELGHPVGRTEVLAPDPTDANVMYLAGANGGIWKTSNWLDPNGPTWTPQTDNQLSPAFYNGYVGLAVAPSNDQIIYGAVSGPGAGIIRSPDGGQSWTTLANGIFNGAALGSLVVDSSNANMLYLSVWYGGTHGGGVYKSTDGGATWNNTTSSFHSGGASDLVINPSTPSILYAGLVGGGSAGIYKTTDGGNSWELLNNGVLAGSSVGSSVRLALAPSAPNTVYATVFDPALGSGGLPHRYRTTDGGASWTQLTATPGTPEGRTWHLLLAVDPTNSQDVFVNDAYAVYRSQDGGKSWALASGHIALDNQVHSSSDDFVGLAFDQAGGWDLFGDRSVYRSTNQGASWTAQQGNLQITQFYDLTLDPSDPNNVYGVAQDHPLAMQFTGDPNGVWNYIGGGGETGKILIDPDNPQRVYEFNPLASDWLVMVSDDGGKTFTGSLGNYINGGGDYSLAYACQRSFAMDPSNPQHLMVGLDSSYFYETFNGGAEWFTSGFLPLNPSPMKSPYIRSLAIAPNGTTFYAGASDGSFWSGRHQNGATIWTEADAGLLGVAKGAVVDIRVNPADSNNLFVVTNGGSGNSVWLSSSGGIADPFTAWINVTGNLPSQYRVATLEVDWQPAPSPPQPPVVYVGTSRGVYYSTDIPQGEPPPGTPPPDTHWTTFGSDLPITSVSDLEYAPNLGILAAATGGRGAFEILLHSSFQFPNFYEVACGDLPCILDETTIAVDPNPEGHVVATFTDAAGPGPINEYRATLQWGSPFETAGIITFDPTMGQFSVHVNETPPEGRYTLTVTIYKNGVAANPLSVDVMVNDAAITGTGGTLAAGQKTALIGLLATVRDVGGLEDPSHYTVSTDWGDRTALDTSARLVNQDGVLQVFGTHTYSQPGSFTVHITVMDEGGSSVPITSTVMVTKKAPTAPPTPAGFAASAGGTGANAGLAIATDSMGNVYVAGTYTGGTFTAGKTMATISGTGGTDAFVAMYSSSGRLLWARGLGGPDTDRATGVAVDGQGNVYVTGDFQGTAQIGRQTFTALGSSDAFVAKLDGKGNFLWSHQFQELRSGGPDGGDTLGSVMDGEPLFEMSPPRRSSSLGDTASGIAVDSKGHVYVTGTFNQKVDFGGPLLTDDMGNDANVYVAKLDTDGHCLWADKRGEWDRFPPSIALDRAGNVYSLMTATMMGSMTGETMLQAPGTTFVDLEKMNPRGVVMWDRTVTEAANGRGTGLAVDHSGNVFVTGFFAGTGQAVDFDPTAMHTGNTDILTPAAQTSNIFVEKFAPTGAFAWVRQDYDENFCTSTGIATDNRGNVFVTGFFHSSMQFGDMTLHGDGPTTAFVTEYTASGGTLGEALGDGVGSKANALAVDPSGFAVFTGAYSGTVHIGDFNPLTVGDGMSSGGDADAAVGEDIFVARLKLATMKAMVRR